MKAPPVPSLGVLDWAYVLGGLAIGIALIFCLLYNTAGNYKGRVFTFVNFWFIMSGVIHSWIEFMFVFYRNSTIIGNGMDLYAAADFRYGRPLETGTAAMEAITALIDGPLCIAVAYAAIHGRGWRHPAQIVLCTMQMYGLLWFILHPLFSDEGMVGHFSSDPVLFWAIAVGMNAPW
eukprot:CAMPEP_0113943074 /NCGR_PEP_ID=MMETSP1339-20121228/19160_1 /TAXON_ID=94617 /ORGANISM="Fibrocapsa japonica" /LENGTH=176 /DNA_ID=CAMNT_0000947837 /DNA_START=52 /DNA_END=579 /DNA_ORIENTATION=+ /assembly_acc=CAM_ASM_000762